MGIKEDIQNSFKEGSMLTKLIYINLGVYVVIGLIIVFFKLFGANTSWINFIMLPSNLYSFAHTPWTIITYMFLHTSFIHLFFNILMLYWFGKLFLGHCTQKDLIGVYILGGIVGGLTYILSYNIFPYFANSVSYSYLLGASASVMAIIVATAVISPEQSIRLMFIGEVRLKWLAIAAVVISMLGATSDNAGGEIAHIGGAFAGYIFAALYNKGKNITSWINLFLDKIINLLKRKPKMNVSYNRKETDQEYNYRKKEENKNIDRILDKIKQNGYDSLSKDEKRELFGSNK